MLGQRGQRGMDGVQARLESQEVMTGHIEEGPAVSQAAGSSSWIFTVHTSHFMAFPLSDCTKDRSTPSVEQDMGHWTLNSYLLQ